MSSSPATGLTPSDLPRDREELARLFADAEAVAREAEFAGHAEAMLLWLALAPIWPKPLVEAGFPGASGLATGSVAVAAVEKAVKAGLARSGHNDADPALPIYWMTQAQSDSFLTFMLRKPTGRSAILAELTRAAKSMRLASKKENGPLADDLERWCRLGEAGPDETDLASALDDEMDEAIRTADGERATECPVARRWIETATPIATRVRGPLWISLLRARRRFELFHRRAADRRMLENFLERPSQIRPFEELFAEGSDNRWALHYVGIGGAGKTMLIRRITEKLAPDRKLASARIDFDHLNPEFPTRAPALLLAAFAEELRLYEKTTPSGFDYFYNVVNSVNERVEARGGAADDETVLREVDPALRAFVDALLKLEMQPLLILDTCEELAKLQPDGTIPKNVRITFEILERIHREFETSRGAVAGLRVIFSGRRPLAQHGTGWTAPESKLPPRNYLRLHVLSGFTSDEGEQFLGTFHDGDKRVPRERFAEILAASRSSDTTFAEKFVMADQAAAQTGDRFNPFDLSMYASMAAAGLGPISAGAHTYVKERIIARLPTLLGPLLPALIRLGTFDRQLVEAIRGGKSVDAEALAAEAADQHWIGRVASPDDEPRWHVDPLHRKRLFDYYIAEDAQSLADGDAILAGILPKVTLERPWKRLDIHYFDAALQVMQHDAETTLDWWDRVEARITADAEWEWAQQLTAMILANNEEQELHAGSITNPLIGASVAATHAAASARMGVQISENGWWLVVADAFNSRSPRGALLAQRARAAIINQLQWSARELPDVVDELVKRLHSLPLMPVQRRDELVLRVALLEGAVETLERAASDPWLGLSDRIREANEILENQTFGAISDADPLLRFASSLLARLAVIRGEPEEAERGFGQSLSNMGSDLQMPNMLDWTPPVDPAVRLRLEAVRGLSLRFDIRKDLGVRGTPITSSSLDADRLVSALDIVGYSAHLAAEPANIQLNRSSLTRQELPCNAHREIPSEHCIRLEQYADRGNVDSAIRRCRGAMLEAEKNADVLLQNDLARLHARLICRYRLFDTGESLSPLIVDSQRLEDVELATRYFTLTGQKWEPQWSGLRGLYVQSRRGLSSNDDHPIKIDADSSFADVWLSIVTPEIIIGGRETEKIGDALEWARAPQRNPLDAIRIITRIFNSLPRAEAIMASLGERAGQRRGAEVIVEESELAAISFALRSTAPLSLAAEWFRAAGDSFGALRATVVAAMARTDSPLPMDAILDVLPSNLPSPSKYRQALRSPAGVDELISIIERNDAGVRPWAVRVAAACFHLTKEADPKAIEHFRSWLNSNATPTDELRRLLPPSNAASPKAKSELLEMAGELTVLAFVILVFSGIGAFLFSFLIGPLLRSGLSVGAWVAGFVLVLILLTVLVSSVKEGARNWLIGFLLLLLAWIGAYVPIVKYTGWSTLFGPAGSFGSIFSLTITLSLLIYLLAQGKRWTALADRLRVRTVRRLAIRPIEATMELKSPFGALEGTLERRPADSNSDSRYSLLHGTLTDEARQRLSSWTRAWRKRVTPETINEARTLPKPLPVEIALLNRESAQTSWEALLDPTLFGEPEAKNHPLGMYRTLPAERSPLSSLTPFGKPERRRPVIVAGITISEGWSQLRDRSNFRKIEIRTLRGGPAEMVHLVGTPAIVRGGLRLEIDGEDRKERGTLLDPQGISGTVTPGYCCIIQGRANDSRVRTETDRLVCSQLRQLGAEVFQQGVPLVLVIPPLPASEADGVINLVGDAIAHGQLHSENAWLTLVEQVRWKIIEYGTVLRKPTETTAELAYDVCLYMGQVPDLRPAFRWFGWFRS